MNRKKFIKLVGGTCIAFSSAPMILAGCSPVHRVRSTVTERTITLSKQEFVDVWKDEERMRDLILINAGALSFPIAVYRKVPDDYAALWMECTHQSCELNAHGKYLDCPCHGSEFDATGKVTRGPAETNLRTFKVTTDNENIYIHL